MTRAALIAEFTALFVLLPVGYRLLPFRLPPLPVLWAATVYCLVVLWRDPGFSRASLWNLRGGVGQLSSVLGIFGVSAVVIAWLVHRITPELFLSLPRQKPLLWGTVMVLYPVLSVYPQSVVYRAFLMHRYSGMFSAWNISAAAQGYLLVLVSAAAFGFMHLVFRNPLAIYLTFAGGLLFAWHYARSGSLAVSALEHALYGCLMFTVGLGDYFYHGRLDMTRPIAAAADRALADK